MALLLQLVQAQLVGGLTSPCTSSMPACAHGLGCGQAIASRHHDAQAAGVERRMASGVLALMGSVTANARQRRHGQVHAGAFAAQPLAVGLERIGGHSSCCIKAVLPSARRRPDVPRADAAAGLEIGRLGHSRPLARAALTMASASGCSLPWSSWPPGAALVGRVARGRHGRVERGFAFGQRAGLVHDQGVDLAHLLDGPASRNSTPCVAARPVATITDIGVASPSAHGQAMISTATALISQTPS
jgi:hypothetical protein